MRVPIQDVPRIGHPHTGQDLNRAFLGVPLGYLLMAGSAALFGLDELGLRLAAALSSVAAVALLVLLRRDAVPLAAAVVAGALAALSPWLIFHGQEARFYAPLLLFATAATLLILPGPGTNGPPAFGTIVMALGVVENDSKVVGLGMVLTFLGNLMATVVLGALFWFGIEALGYVL